MPYTTDLIQITKLIRRNLIASESGDDFLRADSPLAATVETGNAYWDVLLSPDFRQTLEYLHELRIRHEDEVRHILTEEGSFFPVLDKELILLRTAGADAGLTQLLHQEASTLFEKKSIGLLDSQQVCASLYAIQKEVSRIRRELEGNAEKQKSSEQAWRNKIKYSVLGLGGVALVGLNASALAVSLGLGAAATAVSGSIGGSLIGSTLSKIFFEDEEAHPAHNGLEWHEGYVSVNGIEVPIQD